MSNDCRLLYVKGEAIPLQLQREQDDLKSKRTRSRAYTFMESRK